MNMSRKHLAAKIDNNCSILGDHPTGFYSLEILIEGDDQDKFEEIVQKLRELKIQHTVVFDD